METRGRLGRSREDETHCLVGRNVARQLPAGSAVRFELHLPGRNARHVTWPESWMPAAPKITNIREPAVAQVSRTCRGRSLVQLSVTRHDRRASPTYAARLAAAFRSIEVRPIRQVTEAEGRAAGSHPAADCLHGRADSGAHGAVRARNDGGAGDGAPQGCGSDEGARRLDYAHRADYFWPRWACSARSADCIGCI